jgi:hypothetical protein
MFVFPGKDPIKRWLTGGYDLNTETTLPIILSIFDPNSAGHDGAVVIENGKLERYSVRLPMSKTGRLSEEFGTRHHAAMGLSEVTDALVVVVSEERGKVTTFLDGTVHETPNGQEVAEQILSHWQKTGSSAIERYEYRKRRNLVPEMAISLALALAFYSTVVISKMEIREKAFTVPIEYTSAPENLSLAGDNPTEIKLHLTGPKSDLDKVNPSQLNVKIDLSKAKAGRQVLEVSKENIQLPRTVKLVNASPASLSLSLEEIVETEVKVQPQLVGTLPQGLELVSVYLNPETIKVLSPASDTQQGVNIMTTPIYLESIKQDVKLLKKIIAPPNLQPKGRDWPEIEVSLDVRPKG